tara:strand:- start:528 stop:908 length:381 start_codon:yes stop_codon:yes gene_type:complete
MANELTVSASLNYTKNNHQLAFTPAAQQVTVAGEEHSAGVLECGSGSHTAIPLVGMSASEQGYAAFRNIGTSADSHIKIGIEVSSAFHEVINLKGGEFAIMRLGGTALYGKSSASTLYLQYSILEE